MSSDTSSRCGPGWNHSVGVPTTRGVIPNADHSGIVTRHIVGGGELEQIQFLLGHPSGQTTERSSDAAGADPSGERSASVRLRAGLILPSSVATAKVVWKELLIGHWLCCKDSITHQSNHRRWFSHRQELGSGEEQWRSLSGHDS